MYKKETSKLAKIGALVVAGAMVACLGLVGCASNNDESEASDSSPAAEVQEETMAVTVSVAGDEDKNVEAAEETVIIPVGSTAMDALSATMYTIVSEEGQYGPFITSINGVDQTDSSAWTYTVNGEQPTVGAGEYVLNDGDVMEWTLIDF